MKQYLARRMINAKGSIIRQIAEAAAQPGMISFANGNPSLETFDMESYARIVQEELLRHPIEIGRYGRVLGYPPLAETLKKHLAQKHAIDFTDNELIITSGATQAGDLFSKMLLDEGDAVITEEPSFSSFYNIFLSYGAKLLGVAMGEEGPDLNRMEDLLKTNDRIKFIYTIPTFQNPTGYTATLESRRQLYALACRYDVMVLEDDPYIDLRYAGEKLPPIKTLDSDGRIFYCGTLSKVMMPSMRIGYLVCPKTYVKYINIGKQVTDVHSNTLAQYAAERFINTCNFDVHLERCCDVYRKKSNLMQQSLKAAMHPGIRFSQPQGGLFLMIFLPAGCDAVKFTWEALNRGVACVPGSGFMLDGEAPASALRLCYSTPSEDQIRRGAEILGILSRKMLS